jgi:hypothetical protein
LDDVYEKEKGILLVRVEGERVDWLGGERRRERQPWAKYSNWFLLDNQLVKPPSLNFATNSSTFPT